MVNLLQILNGIGSMPGAWGERLGSWGTLLYDSLGKAGIEVLGLESVGKFENTIRVSYQGVIQEIELTGDMSVNDVIGRVIN
jgi:hypothetical protein